MTLACCAAPAVASEAALAWRRDGAVEWRRLDGAQKSAPPARVPLGSLWKLFMYAYLVDRDAQEPPYRCAPGPRAGPSEDDYCCEPGQSVERDEALARSCGRYFEPDRLGIAPEAWRSHWRGGETEAAWLADLARLTPETEVAPGELLAALDAVSPPARRRARAALLAVLTEGYGREALPALGSGWRFKTYTWRDPRDASLRYGGGAGWLADGTAVWFGAPGSSRAALARHAEALARALPPLRPAQIDEEDAPCVEVRFFARYPIRRVEDAQGATVPPGTPDGVVRVLFENGRRLALRPQRLLELDYAEGRPRFGGRFALEDYVARVIDREGDAAQTEAARALAVAARSYVLQQGAPLAGCRAIADDSRTQRVSPNPPTPAARAAARFTEGLALATPVRYHRERAAPGQLSWRQAVASAAAGERFDAILAAAYGRAAFAATGGADDCERLPEAEAWLARSAPAWQRELRRHAGYEAPAAVAVCALPSGHPYSDQRRGRIYVRDWMSGEGRLALAHEYVHLAYPYHPNGGDEGFVERTARRLQEGAMP